VERHHTRCDGSPGAVIQASSAPIHDSGACPLIGVSCSLISQGITPKVLDLVLEGATRARTFWGQARWFIGGIGHPLRALCVASNA
jgi:hypothetical protein